VEILVFINTGNPCLETSLEVGTRFNLEFNVVDFMGKEDNRNKGASLEIINNMVLIWWSTSWRWKLCTREFPGCRSSR